VPMTMCKSVHGRQAHPTLEVCFVSALCLQQCYLLPHPFQSYLMFLLLLQLRCLPSLHFLMQLCILVFQELNASQLIPDSQCKTQFQILLLLREQQPRLAGIAS
jgi:hypothetical protein